MIFFEMNKRKNNMIHLVLHEVIHFEVELDDDIQQDDFEIYFDEHELSQVDLSLI